MRRKRDRNFGIRWLRDLLCGVLIGAGAILPGVSGGVLAVVFDIYRPFMEVLTHPREAIPKYWRWFLPIGLGCAIGFLGFAKGIAAAIDVSSTVTTWLVIGLTVPTIRPINRKMAAVSDRSRKSPRSLEMPSVPTSMPTAMGQKKPICFLNWWMGSARRAIIGL